MLTSIDKGSSRNVFIKINVECFFLEYIYIEIGVAVQSWL